RRLPLAKLAIAHFHFLSLIIEDVERLRRLREKFQVHERRSFCEHGAAALDADIEKNISGGQENEVSRDSKNQEKRALNHIFATPIWRNCRHFNQCSSGNARPSVARDS